MGDKKLQIEIHIDRFHKWRPINYSFVNVLIRPTILVLKERFFCILSVLSRLEGLISTKTTEYYFWPPFMQSVHGNTIRATGPLHSKGKIRVSLLQELFILVVHSVSVSEYGNYTTQAQESPSVRHFSFWEGRGLVTSVLLW